MLGIVREVALGRRAVGDVAPGSASVCDCFWAGGLYCARLCQRGFRYIAACLLILCMTCGALLWILNWDRKMVSA